jgi:general secretion pathway protein J
MVALGILVLIATLIYGALDGMSKTRDGITRIGDRYLQGRNAISRITREMQSAYISLQNPVNPAFITRMTIFKGSDQSSMDRVDFTTFAHRRLNRNVHESDQSEISYFTSKDPNFGKMDIVRREDASLDLEPTKGGTVQVMAEDVSELNFRYFDVQTQQWTDSWDTTAITGQAGRLPAMVKVSITMNHGPGDRPIHFQTKITIPIQLPLSFGVPTGK